MASVSDLETSVRTAAQNLADALRNASEIKVETLWGQVSGDGPADFSGARPVAQTVIALDGDSRTVVPMHPADTGVPNLDEPTSASLTCTSAPSTRRSSTAPESSTPS